MFSLCAVPRLAILSDIHGNLPALEAVLADLKQFTVDRVIVPGDVINWGPFNREVLERVLNEGWSVIRGNNELYVLDQGTSRSPEAWNAYTMPAWVRGQIGELLTAVGSWPDSLQLHFRDAPLLRIEHGLPGNPFKAIHRFMPSAEVEALIAPVTETTFLSGHSHLALDLQVGKHHVFNAGTVGAPFDGFAGATYLLLEGSAAGWRGTFRRVPCDFTPCLDEFVRQDVVAQVGPIGRLLMEEFRTSRMQLHPFKVWLSREFPGRFKRDAEIDPALVERFLAFSEDEKEKFMAPEYHRVNLPADGVWT